MKGEANPIHTPDGSIATYHFRAWREAAGAGAMA
jgi:hypothetical protein